MAQFIPFGGSSDSKSQGTGLFPNYLSPDEESHNPMIGGSYDPSAQNTLDEPVVETIKRDLRMIAYKLKYVLNPQMREEGAKELRDWDLWGPLLLCLCLAFILSLKASGESDTIFGTVFVIVWGGASVLTLNVKFLGGEISFFQSVCVLGYCIFPILLGACAITVVEFLFNLHFIINMAVCGVAFFWSVISSVGFMKALVTDDKKMLAVYPVFLFYLCLSWFVLLAASK